MTARFHLPPTCTLEPHLPFQVPASGTRHSLSPVSPASTLPHLLRGERVCHYRTFALVNRSGCRPTFHYQYERRHNLGLSHPVEQRGVEGVVVAPPVPRAVSPRTQGVRYAARSCLRHASPRSTCAAMTDDVALSHPSSRCSASCCTEAAQVCCSGSTWRLDQVLAGRRRLNLACLQALGCKANYVR